MDEVKAILVQTVTNAGGSIEWNPLLDSVPFESRRYFLPALKALEAEGILRRVVDGTVNPPTFRVVKL